MDSGDQATALPAASLAPDTPPADSLAPYGPQVRSLLDRVRSEMHSIPTELDERLIQPLEMALRRTAEVHGALVDRLLAESSDTSAPGTPSDLASFRESAITQFSSVLLETVRGMDSGTAIGSMFESRLAALRELAAQAPEEIQAPDLPDTYLPSAGDSPSLRLHKLWLRTTLRWGRWATGWAKLARKLMRKDAHSAVAPMRNVPVRSLLEFHVDRRMSQAVSPLHQSLQERVARRYATIERCMTEWSVALVELDEDFGLEELVTLLGAGHDTAAAQSNAAGAADSRARSMDQLTALVSQLTTAPAAEWFGEAVAGLEHAVAGTEAELLADLPRAGTPLLSMADRRASQSEDRSHREERESLGRWVDWHQQVANRLTLNHSVLLLREELAGRAVTILGDARDIAVQPLLDAFSAAEQWIESAADVLQRAFDEVELRGAHWLAGEIEGIRRAGARQLEEVFQDKVARDAQNALTGLGEEQWGKLRESVAQLPDDLLVHSHRHDSARRVDPRKRPFSLDLREIATNALTPAWPPLLAEAAEPLKAGITRAWVGAEKLQTVVEYNLGAAEEELRGPSAGNAEASSPEQQLATARKLAEDALRRSSELLEQLRDSLAGAWSDFASAFDEAVHDDWMDLISQIRSDDQIKERWVGARTRAVRQAERWQDRGETLLTGGATLVTQKANVLRRWATQMVRRGRTAVGVLDTAEEDESTIAETLGEAEAERRALPLVYRRLFALGPVTEPSLLEGRGRDLVSVRRKFERWRASVGPGTMVLTAPVGSGRTSFIEVLANKVFDGATVGRVDLEARAINASEFSSVVSQVMGLSPEGHTLQELESQLRDLGRTPPRVCMIDNLEHLMLQASEGTALLQDTLSLMARTDHAVFWLATISREAWRYFEKSAGNSAASVGSYSLTPIGRKEVESIVLNRHHRSGMTLRFEVPGNPSPILKRRLRRARSPERVQEILQETYFDAVHKNVGIDIALTMLYWLRSVQFQDNGDVVAVRPFQPMNFGQLKRLDLVRLFALKAFLLHNTLNATELAAILRIPLEGSASILEALLNLSLVEPIGTTGDGGFVDTAVERFKLNRLLVHPVVNRLRDARVVY